MGADAGTGVCACAGTGVEVLAGKGSDGPGAATVVPVAEGSVGVDAGVGMAVCCAA